MEEKQRTGYIPQSDRKRVTMNLACHTRRVRSPDAEGAHDFAEVLRRAAPLLVAG